jgi:hypothetical protein
MTLPGFEPCMDSWEIVPCSGSQASRSISCFAFTIGIGHFNPRTSSFFTFSAPICLATAFSTSADPRIGEVGEFGFHFERPAPILAGLSDSVYFAEWHHDQVLASALPSGAISLLTPNELTPETYQDPVGAWHRPIIDAGERARVQALRYDVPPAGRILYTTQFHPDIQQFVDPHVDNNGRQFIRNFLNLADSYWQSH